MPPEVEQGVVVALELPEYLRHLGVAHVDMPLTPERVWRAIRDANPPGT